jgi:serine/threonine protein kinase
MLPPSKISEPIPGYFLKERIGVGGYGEVWSAQAPGDLSKAVKFVYGHFDDERAARELKALKRIKEVRHPFLLSLERIEIVDGQLIIVTELADMSLKDRYEQAHAEGADHIPRDELLSYLRDAADALDYMSDNFSLQHLDVKPENLLLVGKRVKVADFGLVKELQDVTASMMGGLTPVYASPEVFNGQPSQRSDQYSLAIVYQEMLTGVLPFPGKTAAQLASQHVHARPRLTSLPADDQPIIARALSKDPAQRFPSCRALIDALSGADKLSHDAAAGDGRLRGQEKPKSDTTPIRSRVVDTDHDWQRNGHRADSPAQSPNVKTLVIGEEPPQVAADERTTGVTQSAAAAGLPLPPTAPVVTAVDLAPVNLETAETPLRPTLFVGIGGTATRTLRHLRRHLHDRLGPATALPAMEMLLFDTDARGLYQATQGDSVTTLADAQTVVLPLRTARDYTGGAEKKITWLSRRWLYNIPRSLQTEGRRPLGRLALVDHSDLVFERLRAALTAITRPEAITATAAATRLEFASLVPRVFIVASLAGGTGGGMVLDVAYAVRTILAELGLQDDGVCGILAHSTDRNPTAADLAVANTYATLCEVHHFADLGCYPGDPASGIAPFSDGRGPFPHAYLVQLGDNLNDQQFDQATDVLASYLYLSTVTPAAAAFDACRNSPAGTAAHAALRTFGLARIGSTHTSLPALATELLCREVIARWRGMNQSAQPAAPPASLVEMATHPRPAAGPVPQHQVEPMAAAHAEQVEVGPQAMRQQIGRLVEQQLGGDPATLFANLRAGLEHDPPPPPSEYVNQTIAAINNIFGRISVEDSPTQQGPAPIECALEEDLKRFAAPKGAAVYDWVLSLVESPVARVAGAARAKQWYDAQLRAAEAQVSDQLREGQQEIVALEQGLRKAAAELAPRKRTFLGHRAQRIPAEMDSALVHLIGLRCQQATGRLLIKALRMIAAQLAKAGDQIADLQRELGRLAGEFAGESPWDAASVAGDTSVFDEVLRAVADNLRLRMVELVQQVDARIQAEFLDPQGGLRGAFERSDAKRPTLVAALRGEARAMILKTLKESRIDQALLGTSAEAEQPLARLRSCLDAARPLLNRCGGSQRLVAIVPEPAAQSPLCEALARAADPPATVVRDGDADLVLCYEVQDLWPPYVAARLVGDRGDLVQIAARLHTRTDVPWNELSLAVAPANVACAAS